MEIKNKNDKICNEQREALLQKRLNSTIMNNRVSNLENPLNPPFPTKNFLVELTNFCNHNCIFCAQQKMFRKKGFIKKDFLKRILLEAYELGMREVGYYTTGEPFMCNDLAEYVQMANKIGYNYIYITTNGALATPERVKPVLDAGLNSIKFSINAANQELYKFIHGKDDFNIVYNNLKFIYDYRQGGGAKRKNYNIFVSSIQTKYTYKYKKLFEELFKPICDDIIFTKSGNANGLMPEVLSYLLEDSMGDNTIKISEDSICTLPFFSVHISYEGYLTACCADFNNYVAIADLNKISLEEAWNCETFIKLRKSILESLNNESLCFNCIHNLKNEFKPLNKELSSNVFIKDIYANDIVLKRIKKFENLI